MKNDAVDDKTEQITIGEQALSACIGAVATSLLMTPLDVVKIRLQQQTNPMVKGRCFLYSNGLMDHLCTCCVDTTANNCAEWYARPGRFNGTIDAFVKITRNEGIRSLWSGLTPTVIMAVPATVFYFSLYDQLLHRFRRQNNGNPAFWHPMIAGITARATAVTLISPLEMIRTKLQSERLTYRDLRSALLSSTRLNGYQTLWTGWSSTILRDLPFSAIYWFCYEWSKSAMIDYYQYKHTTFLLSFTCGALSGSLAAIITLPFDVIKTRQQIAFGEHNVKNRSIPAVVSQLLATGGYRSFFAGAVPRLTRVAPACAIMIGCYEYGKHLFAAHKD